jgi:hypothetical protein
MAEWDSHPTAGTTATCGPSDRGTTATASLRFGVGRADGEDRECDRADEEMLRHRFGLQKRVQEGLRG